MIDSNYRGVYVELILILELILIKLKFIIFVAIIDI